MQALTLAKENLKEMKSNQRGTTGTGTVLYDHINEGFSSGISRLNPLTTVN